MPIPNKTKPLFLRTGLVDIIVLRTPSPSIVKGRKVDAAATEHTIEGNIQPLKFKDLLTLKESDRTRQWYYIITDLDQDIRGADEGNNIPADMVKWDGNIYQVMKESKWEMGVLDHKTLLVARIPVSGGY